MAQATTKAPDKWFKVYVKDDILDALDIGRFERDVGCRYTGTAHDNDTNRKVLLVRKETGEIDPSVLSRYPMIEELRQF